MAVVFISPKQRQKAFFLGITIILLLFLVAMSFGVFLSKPSEVSTVMVFNRPKVDIDMNIFDSAEFQEIQPFPVMKPQFSYTATTKDNKSQEGFISADSIEQAKKQLEDMGLRIIQIKPVEPGRTDPFVRYYQQAAAPAAAKATTATTAKNTSPATATNLITK
jgi:predicted tellurium resistance membrane protein TerC